MASRIDITPGVGDQTFTTAIDDIAYVFRVRWNLREGAWYMHIYEEDGRTPVALGLKIVLGTYIGRQSIHPLFLSGVFVAQDTTRAGIEPTFDDLGERVQLVRYSLEELANRITFLPETIYGVEVIVDPA